MKHLLTFGFLLFAFCFPLSAQVALNDYILQQRASSSGPLTNRVVTPVTSRLLGWGSSINTPVAITLGTGLSLNTSTNTLSATSSGGTWGSITGALSSQTDLASALAAKQPLDSDLTDIAALTTTSFGRGLLTETDVDTLKATLGLAATITGNLAITGVGGSSLDIGSGGTLGTAAFADYGTDEYQLLRWAANSNTNPITQAVGATELGAIKRVSALPIAAGGTNAETASAALNNLLPEQFDQANKLLMSDGTNASWVLPDIASQTDGLLSADRLSGGTVGADRKITFGASITSAGINIGPSADEPATMTDGDMYYDSASHYVAARVNGYTRRLFDSGNTIGVANGGTGRTSATAYAVVCGGTTSASALQSIASVGTSGQVLTSNGAGALPTFQTISTGLTIGTTSITSGTSGRVLYDNAGAVGEMTTSGSGTQIALTISPTFTTPILGTPASGTLTNCTGLPASSVTAGTFGAGNYIAPDNFQVGNSTADYLSIRANDSGTREIRIGSNYASLGDQSYYILPYVGGSFNSTASLFLGAGVIGLTGDVLIYSRVANNSYTTFLYLDTAATLKLGADAATATAQFVQSHNGSGTDKAGAQITLQGGKSTGTGRGGDVITKTSLTSTTGSSANSYSTRSFASAKPVDLTESSATLFANIAVGSAKIAGAKLICTVYANDGTDYQSLTSEVRVDGVNKAGTVTAAISQTDNTAAVSSGTLTCTYTAVANGNSIDINANAVSSLTQTVLRCKWQVVSLNSDDTATVTAQ